MIIEYPRLRWPTGTSILTGDLATDGGSVKRTGILNDQVHKFTFKPGAFSEIFWRE